MLVQLKYKLLKVPGVGLFPLNILVTELQSSSGHGARQWEWNPGETGEGELPLIDLFCQHQHPQLFCVVWRNIYNSQTSGFE